MIGVVGLGYVGFTSFACLHSIGSKIIGYDSNKCLRLNLKKGVCHIHDKKLQSYCENNYKKFNIVNDFIDLKNCDDLLVCVPTNSAEGKLDLSIVKKVIVDASKLGIKRIWIRSTIDDPSILESLNNQNISINIFPEFLREGSCWDDFFNPPLVVLGCKKIKDSYLIRILNKNFKDISICTQYEAVTVKLLCNSFHALKIAFANEIFSLKWSKIINCSKVLEIFAKDSILNISSAYLRPGLPFGGPCLNKDTTALANACSQEMENTLYHAIMMQNQQHTQKFVDYLRKTKESKIGFYGFQFKPGTGDFRNSPILNIALLLSEYKDVYLFDKQQNPNQEYKNVHLCYDMKDLISKSQIIYTTTRSDNDFVNLNSLNVSI